MPREIVTQDGKTYSYREYSLPPLGPHEVRLQVEFAAPKHGTESHVISGSVFNKERWDADLRMFVPRTEDRDGGDCQRRAFRPHIGNMLVGKITEVGAEATRFKVGERVFGYGSIREEHQADEKSLRPLEKLSPANAVCADPAHVALVAVRDGNIRVGDKVAVFGLGAIGLLAAQIARASGARQVFAVDPFALRRDYAKAHGAAAAFDPTTTDAALEIKHATDNKGVDVAIETSGNSRALHEAIRCIRQCGTVVHVPWGPKTGRSCAWMPSSIYRPTLIGSQAVWDNPDRSHPLWNEERARQTAIDLLRDGTITGEGWSRRLCPSIARRMPWPLSSPRQRRPLKSG